MRAMKDSGIQWIGQIPQGWGLERLKYHASLNPTTELPMLSDGDEVSFIPMEHLKSGFHLQSIVPYMKVKKGYVCFADGDILMAKVTPCLENGNLAIAGNLRKNIGFGSTEINVIRCNTIVNRFLFYLLQCHTYIDMARHHMYGVAGLKRLDPEFIPNTVIPVPSEKEQLKIVSYLDPKCAEIDTLIATKEKINALLKERRQSIIYEAVTKGLNPDAPMKESGVEWIGQIPEHWEVRRLKVIADMQTGTTPPTTDTEFFDGDINWFTPSDFTGKLLIKDSERKLANKAVEEGQAHLFPANTIMIVGIGATVGKTAFTQMKASCNQQITAIQVNEVNRAKYYAYWLYSCSSAIKATANYTTLPIINNQHLGETPCPFVNDIAEQTGIVEYLDAACMTIDNLICTNEENIKKLKEYRQSIIYEAVTGKIEV